MQITTQSSQRASSLRLIAGLVLLVLAARVESAVSPSPKGQWGQVVPIADDAHPNLYYNASEVQEMRDMILVKRSPASLYNLYKNVIKDVVAQEFHNEQTDGHYIYFNNFKAAMSYMVEPTDAKADAMKAALFSYVNVFPNGLHDWYQTPGPHFAGYVLPWMFDLLMAYHPAMLSAADISALKSWFGLSAKRLKFDTRVVFLENDGTPVLPDTLEGKTVTAFPNWFSRYMGPSLACALVSGNQADVDYWADSGWPHTLFTTPSDIASYGLPSTVNRYDLVMYLLSVFPSGANSDSYRREGLRLPQGDWNTTSYDAKSTNHVDGGSYHFAQQAGAIFAAEMAYHNGMTDVYGLTDVPGTEPALLRTFKRAIESRNEADYRPTSLTGNPSIGYEPIIWMAYRRYEDPLIEGAVGSLDPNHPEIDYPADAMQFFGYPRRIAWRAGEPTRESHRPAGAFATGPARMSDRPAK